MHFGIDFAQEAVEDLERLRVYDRIAVLELIDKHLRHEPTRQSKSRIKALRGLLRPQYRLRVGNIRVFYDVREGVVEAIAVVAKADAADWLEREGSRARGNTER